MAVQMRRRELMAAALAGGIVPVALAAPKPVVLELFTSQGCSSCPPADALLGRLAKRPGVVALAWHVDYWDRLGWRDRYASRAATDRQRAYASRLGEGLFTPALVVNGSRVLVGSERASIEAAMAAVSPLATQVTLAPQPDTVTVTIAAAPGPIRAQRIVYDPEHVTEVGAGENDGQRLREYRVVREVEALGEWDGGAKQLSVRLPGTRQGMVVLVQSAELNVLGAADLPPA
jgi:hypothetical protein